MKIDLEKLVNEIMKEIPEFTIPRAYVRNVAEENIDCFDTRSEVTAETKMQLTEDSGLEFMLSRKEAEDYMCDEFSDEKWSAVSIDDKVSSRLIKAMEDDGNSTILELLKNMPLIPAAKLITSIVMKNLSLRGVETTPEDAEAVCMSVIEDLNTCLDELNGDFDDDFDEDDDDDDEDDVFGELGIEFDTDDDVTIDFGNKGPEDLKITRGRRSRITRFPGKK